MIKRERSSNFTIQERDALVDLVQKHKYVLENKESDAISWKKKEAAWDSIEKEFNSICKDSFRSKKTLKIKYEGLKRSVRKKSAAIRSEMYLTGGRPGRAPSLDAAELRIKEMISLTTEGYESVCDSDFDSQNQRQCEINNSNMDEDFLFPLITLKEECVDVSESEATNEQHSEPIVQTRLQEQEEFLTLENGNNLGLAEDAEETNNIIASPSSTSRKWDVTSRRRLKSKKHPALVTIDSLTKAKLKLVNLQTQFLLEEMVQKRKEWQFQEEINKLKLEEQQYRLKKLKETETTDTM